VNGNGIQDSGEPGISGVKVELYPSSWSLPLATTYSGMNGHYQFAGVTPGHLLLAIRRRAVVSVDDAVRRGRSGRSTAMWTWWA